MRTYGRPKLPDGTYGPWEEVSTAADGSNDMVWAVTLCQVLKLSPNESPFYANYGIPARTAVNQQVPPDYYVAVTQQQFSSRFASLIFAKTDAQNPTYNVAITLNSGVTLYPSDVPQ